MEIASLLSKDVVAADLKSEDKEECLKELFDVLVKVGKVEKKEEEDVISSLMEREKLGSTGIGQGVAIPHAKVECINELIAVFGLSKKGIDFNALDGEKVRIIFLLLAPKGITGPHLKALARISRILRDRLVRERIMNCKDSESVISVLSKQDKKN